MTRSATLLLVLINLFSVFFGGCTLIPYDPWGSAPELDVGDADVTNCNDLDAAVLAGACPDGQVSTWDCTDLGDGRLGVSVTCGDGGGDTVINVVIVMEGDEDNSSDNDTIVVDDDDATPPADDDDVTSPPAPYEGDDPGECADGADNDIDGLFDCADPDCFGSSDCAGDDDDSTPADDDDDTAPDDDDATPSPPYEGDEPGECDDGADNDIDGLFDCADSGCFGAPVCADGDDDDATPPDDDDAADDDDTAPDDDDATPPPAGECDDGVDNNGDGLVDGDDLGCDSSFGWRRDWDGDGFPNISGTSTGDVVFQESDPSGTWDYYIAGSVSGDCGDSIPTVYPGADEFCNGLDDDCNGIVDDADWDGDGYVSCPNYVGPLPNGDCADLPGSVGPFWQASWIHPGQIELGDWIDTDCDGTLDNGIANVCAAQYGGFELNGGADDCADGFSIADRSATNNPMDPAVVISYDSGMLGGTSGSYTGVTTTNVDTLPNGSVGSYDAGTGQSDPGNWWPMMDPGTPLVLDSIMELIESNNCGGWPCP